MEWWEKEQRFYKARRTVARNIWRYIPEKYWDAVDDAITNSDGYWVYLADGWTAYDGGSDCGVIHVYTIEDLKADLRTIRKGVRE